MRKTRSMIATRMRFGRFGIRNSGANCKTPAACTFQGPFPLTPALSLREREHHRQRIRQPEALGVVEIVPWFSLSLRARAGVRGNGACEYQRGAAFAIASRNSDFFRISAFGLRVSD